MSREEIVGALKTLQDCCRTHKRCENCPLRNEPARCGVTSASECSVGLEILLMDSLHAQTG
jgi:hypothetical protein